MSRVCIRVTSSYRILTATLLRARRVNEPAEQRGKQEMAVPLVG